MAFRMHISVDNGEETYSDKKCGKLVREVQPIAMCQWNKHSPSCADEHHDPKRKLRGLALADKTQTNIPHIFHDSRITLV